MDAIAVSLASRGEYVGIAPLGTAFTEAQAAKLKPYLRDNPHRLVIAMDPDSAGWQSAERAFWRLAAVRANPQHLPLPEGIDPADILRTEGPAALAERLTGATDFAELLIDRLIDDRLATHSDAFSRVDLNREVALIIGALPPDLWSEHAQHVAERLSLPLATVCEEVLEAGTRWTDDPQASATRAIAAYRPSAPAALRPTPPELLQPAMPPVLTASPSLSRRRGPDVSR